MNYLIPANAKSGKLIFNIFRPFDLILAASGVTVSILALIIVSPSEIFGAIMCLLPALICAFLVIPVPNYHNILVVITDLILFFYNRRNYKWKGWCYKDEYK